MTRIKEHPILPIPDIEKVSFHFEGKPVTARRGEVISSALFANGIRTFGLHPADGAPQGIFCANGQCSQCMVIADGLPVKACMVSVAEGMQVHKLVNLPMLPDVKRDDIDVSNIEEISTDLLVIGAGPSGLGAAIEAAGAGLDVLVVDDKEAPGGKLLLQTHSFFGSVNECYAGTRGLDIACILSAEAEKCSNIMISTKTMAVGVYGDGKIGVLQDNVYKLIKPKSLLIAAGAREKALVFPGCDLPGVYGAGAFQTLLNRDLVVPSRKLFIVGGGNVGIIAGYHALQAGIEVVGLVEGLPEVGGYHVHADKLRRLGVPIHTSTTVVSANGKDAVESVTVAEVDRNWKIVPGTYRAYPCDTLLIAVGLSSINELHLMAKKFGIDSYVAGDAEEIAEASAAMFSGRVAGRRIAREHGRDVIVPGEWKKMTSILKSKPGRENFPVLVPDGATIFPVLHCVETIPCNPCSEVCPQGAISMPDGGILSRPEFSGDCTACGRCVAACPGLAITLVDYRATDSGKARVTFPFEMPVDFKVGDAVRTVAQGGEDVTKAKVVDIIDKTSIAPCRAACPAEVRAPCYIELIRKGNFARAADILRRDLPLPSVCGRVCYHPCEDECARSDLDEPLAICALKRFVSDWAMEHAAEIKPIEKVYDEKVAVIGSGPAGLACANELIHRGYPVKIFEARGKAGGMLRYGIPAYRLPDDILDWEIGCLEMRGIDIETGVEVESISKLLDEGYKSVFVATGAQTSVRLNIDGEDRDGVSGVLDFLHDVNVGKLKTLDGTVVVIGGGNSAIDAARAAVRLGAKEAKIVYRRSRDEMPAHDREIDEAMEEGVVFEFLTAPVEIIGGDGKLSTLRCTKMKLAEPDASGRPRPVPVEGSEFEIPVDFVISAIGQSSHAGAFSDEITMTNRGTIEAAEITCQTSMDGVFAGGDVATGAATVARAFGMGKRAAESIDRYLRGVDIAAGRGGELPVAERNTDGLEKKKRVSETALHADDRRSHFGEIVATFTGEEALREAERCLGCGLYSECMPGPSIMSKYPAVPGVARSEDKSVLVTVEVERELATKIAGIRIQDEDVSKPVGTVMPEKDDDDVVVCRCERITLGKIRAAIGEGVRDMNQLKAMLKVGMGACGGKTCGPLIESILRREGVPPGEITYFTERPLVTEVPMGVFAGIKRGGLC